MIFTIEAKAAYELYRLQEDRSWRCLFPEYGGKKLNAKDLTFQTYGEEVRSVFCDLNKLLNSGELNPSPPGSSDDIYFFPRAHRITKPRKFTFEEMEEVLAKDSESSKNYLVLSLEGHFEMRTPAESGVLLPKPREVKSVLVGEEQEVIQDNPRPIEMDPCAVKIGPLVFMPGQGYIKLGDYCPPEVVECYKAICKQVPQEMVTEANEVLLKSEHSRPNNSYECLEEQIRGTRQDIFLKMLSVWIEHLREGRFSFDAGNGDCLYNLRRMMDHTREGDVWTKKSVVAMFESGTMDEKVMWGEVEELTRGLN